MRRMHEILLVLCLSILLSSGCAAPIKGLYPPIPNDSHNKTIFIVAHKWHTGIVFKKNEANPYLSVLDDDFIDAKYLEIGWGDEGYFQAERATSGLALRAIFWPTNSALHVVAVPKDPRLYFPSSEAVRIELSNEGFKKLVGYINDSFAVDEKSKNIKLGKGLYGDSQFYRAKGKYYFLNSCNRWTAKALRTSGFPITTFCAVTSNNILYKVNKVKHE